METETDIYGRDPAAIRASQGDVLYVAFHGNDPRRLPSRHVLPADLQSVSFGRGEPAIIRDARSLAIRLDDPLLSKDHGRLTRNPAGTWQLDDPMSKNAALVGATRTRSHTLEPGQLFALGHTLFVMARERIEPALPQDLTGADLPAPLPQLATFDPGFGEVITRLARIATTPIPVLLLGDTGTGKEVTASAIHELSRRRGRFVAVNCGAITSTLLESELFGHRKGAFSGAITDKPGFVRSADEGTLFLDEVGELPLPAQAALLRVLQEHEVVPVGDALPVPVDLRVVCATHRDLESLVADGKFRHDLHARIAGATFTLPRLRARRADLGLLIQTLLRKHGARDVVFTPQAAIRLFDHAWPTNIRELDKALVYAIALADGAPITLEHLPDSFRDPAPPPKPAAAAPLSPRTPQDEELKQKLELQLGECAGNVAEVARRLDVDRKQVYRWLDRFGIPRPK